MINYLGKQILFISSAKHNGCECFSLHSILSLIQLKWVFSQTSPGPQIKTRRRVMQTSCPLIRNLRVSKIRTGKNTHLAKFPLPCSWRPFIGYRMSGSISRGAGNPASRASFSFSGCLVSSPPPPPTYTYPSGMRIEREGGREEG